jgi:hypothetical protein
MVNSCRYVSSIIKHNVMRCLFVYMLDLSDVQNIVQDQPYCVTGSMEEWQVLNNCLKSLNDRSVLRSFLSVMGDACRLPARL